MLHIHGNFSLEDIESMLPFEREIYAALLIQHLKEKEDSFNGNV